MNYKELIPKLDPSRLPAHIGIIMDGNGRWASKRHRPRLYGHRAGARSIRQVVELAVELKLGYLTFFAFSTENWNRPADEVQGLLKMLRERLIKEIPELNKQNIHVRLIGGEEHLDPNYLDEVRRVAALTDRNTGLTVNIAFNYGGRSEIIRGVKKMLIESIADPQLLENLTEQSFSAFLDTAGQPDPDLIIRTSGELRLSNFLLWQSAYAELYTTQTLWPDFHKVELLKALLDFQGRQRRFGGVESK